MSHPHFHVNRSLLSTAERTGRLDLHGYALSSLPADLFTTSLINSLQSLDLGQNRFREIPVDVGKFIHLKELILDENPLRSLSSPLLECRQLKWLGLNDMPYLDDKWATIYQKCTRHNKARTRDAVPILRALSEGGGGPSAVVGSLDDDSLSKYVRENSPHTLAPSSVPPPASLADQFHSRVEASKRNRDVSSVSHIFHEEEKEAIQGGHHAGKRRDQRQNQQKSSIFATPEENTANAPLLSPNSNHNKHTGKRMGGFESYSGQPPALQKQNSNGTRYQHTPKVSAAPFATNNSNSNNAQEESTPSQYRPSRRQSKPAIGYGGNGSDAPYGTAPSHDAENHFRSSSAEAQAAVLAAKAGENDDRLQNGIHSSNVPPRSKGGYIAQSESTIPSAGASNLTGARAYLGEKPVSEMTDDEVKELAKRLLEEEKYLDEIERENQPTTASYDDHPHYQPSSPPAVPSAALSPPSSLSAARLGVKASKADPISLPPAGVPRVSGALSLVGAGKKGQQNDAINAPISQIFLADALNKPRAGKRIAAGKGADRRAPFGRIEDGETPVTHSAPAPSAAYRPPWGLSIDQQIPPPSSYQQRQDRAPISQIFGDGVTNAAKRGKGRGARA